MTRSNFGSAAVRRSSAQNARTSTGKSAGISSPSTTAPKATGTVRTADVDPDEQEDMPFRRSRVYCVARLLDSFVLDFDSAAC